MGHKIIIYSKEETAFVHGRRATEFASGVPHAVGCGLWGLTDFHPIFSLRFGGVMTLAYLFDFHAISSLTVAA